MLLYCGEFSVLSEILHLQWNFWMTCSQIEKQHFLFRRALVSLCGFVATSCAPPFHRNHLSPLAQSGAQRASRPHPWWEWDLQISRSDTLTTQALVQSRFCFKHPELKRLFDFLFSFCFLGVFFMPWTWTNTCGMFWHRETPTFFYFVFWSVWLRGTAARAKWESESSVRLHKEIPSRLFESLEAAENEHLQFLLPNAL